MDANDKREAVFLAGAVLFIALFDFAVWHYAFSHAPFNPAHPKWRDIEANLTTAIANLVLIPVGGLVIMLWPSRPERDRKPARR